MRAAASSFEAGCCEDRRAGRTRCTPLECSMQAIRNGIIIAMPTIPPPVLDTSIYLYPSEEAADGGERAGGSGFLVAVELEGYPVVTHYAVTNAHVAGNGATTVRLNTKEGRHASIHIPDEQWFRHPDGDDVVIAEIGLPEEFRFSAIPHTNFIDGTDPRLFTVGQEVYMVGRFVTHEGRQRNLPTARFGHISQLPHERIRSSSGIEQEGFLVDIRSLSGYSGSPVFVYRTRPDLNDPSDVDNWIHSFEHRLLGIDFGHLPAFGPVCGQGGAGLQAEQNSGMAAVIPAWRILQLLQDDDVVAKRRQQELRWLEENGH
jgi:hypothetical protein